jgi:hypothetical protein
MTAKVTRSCLPRPFLDYRDFDNVRDNLVARELRAALNGLRPITA